jgi:hypothetical protein
VRSAFAWAAIAATLLASFALQWGVLARTGFQAGDFRAFYCAGRLLTEGADPYRDGPLHACETANGPHLLFEKEPGVTVPAPLPGYAIAAFAPLSRLPFAAAAAIWIAILACATICAALLLARFVGTTSAAAIAALGISVGIASVPFGEVVPIAICAICASAYFAWRGRWTAAALCAAVAMIEPHLGLPVCAALFVWSPAARVTTLGALGALGILSLAVLGPATNAEYFLNVLPAHALSEAARDTQFSLTGALTSLGVKDAVAVRLGMLDYGLMLAAGIYAGGVLSRTRRNDAFLACVPAAFVLLGGTFIHVTQIAAAIPAAMLLADSPGVKARIAAIAGLLLLTVPWIMAWSPALGLAPALPIAFLVWHYRRTVLATVAGAALAFLVLLGLSRSYGANFGSIGHPATPTAIDRTYAEAPWRDFSLKTSTGSVASWLARVPTWGGLTLIVGLCAAGAVATRKPLAFRQIAKTAG